MTTKFSQLPVTTNLATPANILFPVVDTSGPTSFTTALTTLSAQILSGNAATATKLQTARTINGVSFDGSANISITASLATATASVLGGVKVGTGISVSNDGTISTNPLIPTTSTVLGGIIVPTGSGNKVDISGNLSSNTVLHAFSFDGNNNLIYQRITDTTVTLSVDGITSPYATTDMGTDQYVYSLDNSGNLLATYNY